MSNGRKNARMEKTSTSVSNPNALFKGTVHDGSAFAYICSFSTRTFLAHSRFSLAIASLSTGSCFWVTAFYNVTFCPLGTEKPNRRLQQNSLCIQYNTINTTHHNAIQYLAITFIVTSYCYMLTSSLHGFATTSL